MHIDDGLQATGQAEAEANGTTETDSGGAPPDIAAPPPAIYPLAIEHATWPVSGRRWELDLVRATKFADYASATRVTSILDPWYRPVQVPGSPAATDSHPSRVSSVLAFGQSVITVDLRGSRLLKSAPEAVGPIYWRQSPDDVPSSAVAPVCIGAGMRGCMFIDLALAPGAVSVSGELRMRVVLAAELVNRVGTLGDGRFSVVKVGRPFHSGLLLVDMQRVAYISDFDVSTLPGETELCLLLCKESEMAESGRLAAITQVSRPRIIPILLGSRPSSAWSLRADPASYERYDDDR